MANTITVNLPSNLYAEFVLRRGKSIDIDDEVFVAVESYLDMTLDSGLWENQDYMETLFEEEDRLQEFGSSTYGIQWQNVFIPNRSTVKMIYKGETVTALVKHQKIQHDDKALSPSEFASIIAKGTTRNAWRDLSIKFPDKNEWHLAEDLRSQDQRKGIRR